MNYLSYGAHENDFINVSKTWCAKFLQAAKQEDAEQLEMLVDSLDDKLQALKQGLVQLIETYRFDKISQFINEVLKE